TLSVTLAGDPVALGTLLSSQTNFDAITSTVTTNANAGYASHVKFDATLTSGSNTIPVVGGDNTLNRGTSEYGASTSDSGNDLVVTDTDITCNTTAATDSGQASLDASPLTTTFKTFASNAGGASAEATTLCFLASISATQQAGTYTSIATVVTTARF
ncbi:MAG: hypothetical protein HYY50_04520, partial [Candidatus Kerfeldbacteria bacterium]|nr:hypothetical protein [Candidatus Kerfeldbacteria bacterium]